MEKQQLIHNKWSDLRIILLGSQYDFDGWIDVNELEKEHLTNELEYKEYSKPDSDFKTMLCRPKSLQGIEDNNGWIKIESENDLPGFKVQYFVMINGKLSKAYYRGNNRWIVDGNDYPKTSELHEITHWQEIVIPKAPIF